MSKSPDAFRTISEVSEWLDTPSYVLRFWESKFSQIKPVKRAGGRRYYRPDDMMLLGGIKKLLHFDELSIKTVKQLLKDKGVKHIMSLSPDLDIQVVSPQSSADSEEKANIAKIVESTAKQSGNSSSQNDKPKIEVRVVKKGKVSEEQTMEAAELSETEKPDPMAIAQAEKKARTKAAKVAAARKAKADEDAVEWEDLAPDMVINVPYALRPANEYDREKMSEIETLYYSLRIARNNMRRNIVKIEERVG